MENQESVTNQEQNPLNLHTQTASSSDSTMKLMSLIAAGMVFLGFFLPWITIPDMGKMFGNKMPALNGLGIISELSKISSNAMGTWTLLGMLLLLTIPVFSVLFFVTRLNKGYENKQIGTIAVSFLTFIPILFLTSYLFIADALSNFGLGKNSGGLGTGALFMMLGSCFLMVDTILQLTKIKVGLHTSKLAWGKGAIAGSCIGIAFLVLGGIAKNLFSIHQIGGIYFVGLIIFISGIFFAIQQHQKLDLNNRITFDRAIGTGIIASGIAGLTTYFALLMSLPELQNNLPPTAMLELIFIFMQLGFIVSSIIANKVANLKYNPTPSRNAVQTPLNVEQTPIQAYTTPPPPQYTSDVIVTPSVPLSERFAPFTNWLSLHRKKIGLISSGLLISVVIYKFFIALDPLAEGKKVAQKYCSCEDESEQKGVELTKRFLSEFNPNRKLNDLKSKMDSIDVAVKAQLVSSDSLYKAVKSKFIGKAEQSSQFEEAVREQRSLCLHKYKTEYERLNTQCLEKINALSDKEHEIQRLKMQSLSTLYASYGTLNVDGITNLRSLPDKDNGQATAKVSNGALLSYDGQEMDRSGIHWYRVSYNGQYGWLSGMYARLNGVYATANEPQVHFYSMDPQTLVPTITARYIELNDNAQVFSKIGDFVFVEFTNVQGQTTKGWLKLSQLR